MSRNAVQTQASTAHAGLNPHHDARKLVRLFQCAQCSYPYRKPVTLPCGNTLCKECIPPLFKRENITYPLIPGRSEGFVCPFEDCELQHTLGDCGSDITLTKVVESIRTSIKNIDTNTRTVSIRLDEKLDWPRIVDSSIDVMPRSRAFTGGRVAATFNFAEIGELNYHSDVAYTAINETLDQDVETLDIATAHIITELVQGEVECQVCYALMLDPLTTSCGHSFCRKCVARILDHSDLCPMCRRRLAMVPGVQHEARNKGISGLISSLLPDQLQTRVDLAESEDAAVDAAGVPLFPCSLAFPSMPTFLHIFEPRYRLMIRRVMENGTRKFGILAYNSSRQPQGTFGRSLFMQYGTMLYIQRIELFPDGRSLVETVGSYRFKVLEHATRDEYMVGRVERVDDIPYAEEEALEAAETSTHDLQPSDQDTELDHTSTQGLLQIGLDFIQSARQRSAPWLHERVLAAFGQPPTDPATFPYWFASVLPISEEEKYTLLPTTSVRGRLKITARWIQRLEAARCIHEATLSRTVLDDSGDEEDDSSESGNDDGEDEVNDTTGVPHPSDTNVQDEQEAIPLTTVSQPPSVTATVSDAAAELNVPHSGSTTTSSAPLQ